ncbi:MAG: glycosyltransferase family 2 protein [Halolamina sp.]
MNNRIYATLWFTAIVVAIMGVIAIGVRYTPAGWWLLAGGGGVLTAFAFRSAWQTTRSRVARPVGGLYVLVTGALISYVALFAAIGIPWGEIPLFGRVGILVTGMQALFLAVGVRVTGIPFVERVVVPAAGHLLLLTGSVLILGFLLFGMPWVVIYAAGLVYATGFSALALHSFWLGQHADEVVPPRPFTIHRYWEQVLIVALIGGLVSVAIASITLQANVWINIVPEVSQARAVSIVAGSAAVIAIATLAPPDVPVAPLRRLTGPLSTITQHAVMSLVMLNGLAIALMFLVPAASLWVLGGYLTLLAVGALVEYGMIAHALRHRPEGVLDEPVPPLTERPPVTVVVTAFDEADVLPASLDRNLDALDGISVLLVPAEKSTDRTVAIAEEYREQHPDRVRVIEGTTGSKAGDINLAWEYIDTPYVLLLDADETVDAAFVARGLAVLEDSPSVGIVQGRKVERYPYDTGLARFVSGERRLSTWIDHPFMHDVFGASHFAGSAALLRHEVPLAVDGWSDETLTEDIDLTLRLYLDTDWRVRYVPGMVAWTLNPKSVLALVRQRRRWARGWVSALATHGVDILRAGRRLGWTRSVGLLWLLFTAVNAPLYTVFPALVVVWLLGLAPTIPLWLAVGLAIFILPVRAISFGYAALRDPVIPIRARPLRIVELLVHAYLWIPMYWLIQLHALYLQLSGAPKIWEGTEKATRRPSETTSSTAASIRQDQPK